MWLFLTDIAKEVLSLVVERWLSPMRGALQKKRVQGPRTLPWVRTDSSQLQDMTDSAKAVSADDRMCNVKEELLSCQAQSWPDPMHLALGLGPPECFQKSAARGVKG